MNETRAERHFLLDEVLHFKGDKDKAKEYSIARSMLRRFVKSSPVGHKIIQDGVSTDARPLLLLDEEEGDTMELAKN